VVTISRATSPDHSAVVEACAGSGKTWLLVSRMIRLLLSGVDPSELLAITFTRKAAEEMRGRLFEWLEFMATASDQDVSAFLMQRGLGEPEAMRALPRARGLFETVLHATPGPMITTFHGWFLNLLSRAPLTRRAPANLIEDVALLKGEAWQTWTESLRATERVQQAEALAGLMADLPMDSVRALVFGLLEKRAEWWAWAEGLHDPVGETVAAFQEMAGLDEELDVVAAMWAEPGFRHHLTEFKLLLADNAAGVKLDGERAEMLARLLTQHECRHTRVPQGFPSVTGGNPDALENGIPACAGMTDLDWSNLQSIFLTAKGEPLSRKPGPTLDKRLGAERATRFLELHDALATRVIEVRHALEEQSALRLNRLALIAGTDLIARYQALKRERDGLDFTDAEWLALQLLSDPEESSALLAKLDARWKHLLLDEFQDANPLQWRILAAWLDSYGADPDRPTVFVVGDPKQSIYRFRRAEPRIFEMVGRWLEENFDAIAFRQNETRRCAPRVVAWVNAVFSGLGDEYPGFMPHSAHQLGLSGRCELLIAPPSAPPQADEVAGLRDPLTQAPPSQPDKRSEEAAQVAQRILDIVGSLTIAEDGGRPARFGDILVLAARRSGLEAFEAAFKTAGIPYLGSRRGGLLDALEVADLRALLGFLVMPHDNLKLAHALKSPLFGFSDEDLIALRDSGQGPWSARLREWSASENAPSRVGRANALLEDWQAVAGHLPPHDLLDRIFHQGEVEARYAGAVSDRLRPSVLANLRGLLELSLSLGSGRFPSLPRFLDELDALQRRAGDEAPDEPPAATGDVVRMLTIHAAKGLEAPVVFIIKADEERRSRDHYGAILDWPPDAERPIHFSMYGPSERRGHARQRLFEQEREQEARENLNLLYVAMTRARQALIVSGLDGAKDGTWLARLLAALDEGDFAGLPEMEVVEFVAPAQAGAPSCNRIPACDRRESLWDAAMTAVAIGRRRPPSTPEIEFGIRVHRYLELASEGMGEERIRHDLGLDETTFLPVHAMAARMLSNPQTRRFFESNGVNELEYVGDDGRLRRADRVVELDGEIWVLDYKTGDLAEADPGRRAEPYFDQLADYRRAVAMLYPGKPVRTALLFGDGLLHEVK
jgi:ATP-dependent helicase/nuclease subunit A